MKNMEQLSGGQKTVVALSFILAIQRSDPAPFYLLDEVDAALDSEFRANIADLIAEQVGKYICSSVYNCSPPQASSTQFLATTFRPELLQRADKLFGVNFRGISSQVKEIRIEEARNFVLDP